MVNGDDNQRPATLEYERPRRGLRPPAWLLYFAAIVYAVTFWFCHNRPFAEIFAILEVVTFVLALFAAVVLGVRYGTDGNRFRGG